jgi:hypothetical protein
MRYEKIISAIKGRACFVKKDAFIVFVCGKALDDIESKRKLLMKYVSRHLAKYNFLLAEKFFKADNEYKPENMLADEHRLAKYSDCIIIILESASSFAELGAFASIIGLHKSLIIINDKKHKDSPSFVNQGIIRPIERTTGELNQCIYVDWRAFSSSFAEVTRRLEIMSRKQRKTIVMDSIADFDAKVKERLLLTYEIINLLSPITKKELINLFALAFGSTRYDVVHKDVQMLMALEFVSRQNEYLLSKRAGLKFIDFPGDGNFLIRSECVAYYKKHDPAKLDLLARREHYV